MEKRQYTRIELAVSVRATVSNKNESFDGVIDDLSINGMLFKSSKKLQLNEDLTIEIFPSEDDHRISLKTEGIAVRNVKDGVGICFNKPEHDLFEKFIKIALLKMTL
ncbi:MAG: PilZ domain-containing protein [Candidatus Magnetomorum sp.]|nr:PilZ domain-containing protein [Candidatus Magnetomorum sp.]